MRGIVWKSPCLSGFRLSWLQPSPPGTTAGMSAFLTSLIVFLPSVQAEGKRGEGGGWSQFQKKGLWAKGSFTVFFFCILLRHASQNFVQINFFLELFAAKVQVKYIFRIWVWVGPQSSHTYSYIQKLYKNTLLPYPFNLTYTVDGYFRFVLMSTVRPL